MADQFDLQEDLAGIQDVSGYTFSNDGLFSDNGEAERTLEGAVEAIAESSEAILEAENFDACRRVLKHAAMDGIVTPSLMNKLLDSIVSGFQAELDATCVDIDSGDVQRPATHRITLEMYAFLLQWFVEATDKVKGKEEEVPAPIKAKKGRGGRVGGRTVAKSAAALGIQKYDWIEQAPVVLDLVCHVLNKLGASALKIWSTTVERDLFMKCLTRPAYAIAAKESYMKIKDIRSKVIAVICIAVKHHNHAFAARVNIMQLLSYEEHLSEHMAECLHRLSSSYAHTQLTEEILREISGKTFTSSDGKGPRSFSKFLIHLSELSPQSLHKSISLLQGLLNSESYPMRIAVVEILGALIQYIAGSTNDNGDTSNMNQISSFFDVLLQRMLDNSSYVRIKVLGVFAKLCDMPNAKYPKQRIAIAMAAVTSLEDKIATVRKWAIVVLTRLLLTHPWSEHHGGLLRREQWDQDFKMINEAIHKVEEQSAAANAAALEAFRATNPGMEPEPQSDSMEVDDGEQEEEEEEEEEEGEDDADTMAVDGEENERTPRKKHRRSKKKKPRKLDDDDDIYLKDDVIAALDDNELKALKLRRRFLAEGRKFMSQIEIAMPVLVRLLGSKNKAEQLEVMNFLCEAHTYGFEESAEEGIKKMLHLIWTKDDGSIVDEHGVALKGVRSRVLECYTNLYFSHVTQVDDKAQVNRVVKNMLERTYNATLAKLTSLEEMMRIMIETGQIDVKTTNKLWQVYDSKKNLQKEQRRGAIIILGMLALGKRSVLKDRIELMLGRGLGSDGKSDLLLARYTCVALQRLNGSAKKVKGSLEDKVIRFPMDDRIFSQLSEVMLSPSRSRDWFGLAEQAINTIYALGEHPDELCSGIVKQFTARVFNSQRATLRNPDAMNEDTPENPCSDDTVMQDDIPSATQSGHKDVGDAFELSQLLFVVGHVAIRHLVYLELVEREWKRQKDAAHQESKKDNQQGSPVTSSKDGEELDQVVGSAEDEVGDRIQQIREHEMLYGEKSLLSIYGPMLKHICGNPGRYKNKTLRAAAILSFSKFLCVSSQFCDDNHLLLFKLLDSSRTASVRSNIVIALGDVAVSFNNIIDENSHELYKGLSDKSKVVKKNTLMVLTHLILNGMVKVKGQLGEMAKCLEDDDQRIADLAKLFFTELSTKDNAIYNNLPDIISHLSIGPTAVNEETFHAILKFIFTFIEKDKQAENIVDKLCQRFKLSEEPRQWRDIAYCLSLLQFKSERSVKKLIEGFPHYKDKLHEEKVYLRFNEILTKARSNKASNKPDTELNEFEALLQKEKEQGQEDQALEKRARGKKGKKPTKKAPAKKKTRSTQETQGQDIDVDDE